MINALKKDDNNNWSKIGIERKERLLSSSSSMANVEVWVGGCCENGGRGGGEVVGEPAPPSIAGAERVPLRPQPCPCFRSHQPRPSLGTSFINLDVDLIMEFYDVPFHFFRYRVSRLPVWVVVWFFLLLLTQISISILVLHCVRPQKSGIWIRAYLHC